jgi:hypothetical protein
VTDTPPRISVPAGAGNVADQVRPVRPPGQVGLLTDRLLVAAGTRDLQPLLPDVDDDRGGVWVCGADASVKVAGYRDNGFTDLVLVADPEAYVQDVATADEPFRLPEQLFSSDLHAVLDDQLVRGATVAVTPSRYVGIGDSDSLKAMVRQAARLGRDDTILIVPVAVAWLNSTYIRQFIAALRFAELPVAIMLGGQFDPVSVSTIAENLRQVEAEVPHVMRARTDLSALDGLAHGAFAGAIGVGGTRRHLIPPGEPAKTSSRRGSGAPPSVIVRDLMAFKLTTTLETAFANATPPSCSCRICGGRSLTRMLSATDRREARAHNMAVWTEWMDTMAGLPTVGSRAVWWKASCQAAVDYHTTLSQQLDNGKDFTLREPLPTWARLDP